MDAHRAKSSRSRWRQLPVYASCLLGQHSSDQAHESAKVKRDADHVDAPADLAVELASRAIGLRLPLHPRPCRRLKVSTLARAPRDARTRETAGQGVGMKAPGPSRAQRSACTRIQASVRQTAIRWAPAGTALGQVGDGSRPELGGSDIRGATLEPSAVAGAGAPRRAGAVRLSPRYGRRR